MFHIPAHKNVTAPTAQIAPVQHTPLTQEPRRLGSNMARLTDLQSTKKIDMKIIVRIEKIYGNRVVYPVCETALLLAELSGKKTLTNASIITIKSLGYSIQEQQDRPASV